MSSNLQSQPEVAPSIATPPPAVPAGRPPPSSAPAARRAHRRFSVPMAVLLFAGLAVAGGLVAGGTILLSARIGLAPERALAIAGTLGGLVALGAGFVASAWARKIGFYECFVAGLVFALAGTAALARVLVVPFGLYRPEFADIAYLANLLGNPIGGVVLAAVVLWGAAFVGGSLGFLFSGSGRFDPGFSYEAFIARSHLRLRHRSATRLMTVISVGGVAVGVLALTVVLSVMSGFELDLKTKIVGTNAHAVVLKYGTDFREWRDTESIVARVKGVTGVSPFILNEVMVSSDQNIGGALVKGIDPQTVAQVSNLPSNLQEGKLDWLEHAEKIPTEPLHRNRIAPTGTGEAGDEDASARPPARARAPAWRWRSRQGADGGGHSRLARRRGRAAGRGG